MDEWMKDPCGGQMDRGLKEIHGVNGAGLYVKKAETG
jgi:hypothetical protein